MERENNSGVMAPSTRATGLTIWPVGMEDLSTETGMYTKGNGSTIRPTVRVFICTRMVHPTSEIGSKTSNMAKVLKNGSMGPSTRVNIVKVKSRVEVHSIGEMEAAIRESL